MIVQIVTHNSIISVLTLTWKAGSVSDYGAVGAGQHSGASNTALEVPVDQRGQQNVAVGGATDQTQTSYNVYSWYGFLKFV